MKLRTLLFALLLAVAMLPEGATLCLRQLTGMDMPATCCMSRCSRAPQTPGQSRKLELGAARGDRCCISVPASERSFASVPAQRLGAERVTTPAPVFIALAPRPVRLEGAPRRDHGRPPSAVPRSLPLRI